MVKTSTRIVGAFALAGALMSNGPALAATSVVLNPNGDLLSKSRNSAGLTVSVVCDAAVVGQTKTTSLTVKIFQSVGRLLNIGTTNPAESLTCTGNAQQIDVTVDAIPGLAFQPGPATALVTLTETTTVPNPVIGQPDITTTIVTEIGGRVNLHP